MTAEQGILLQVCLLIALAMYWLVLKIQVLRRQLRVIPASEPVAPASTAVPAASTDATVLTGAGAALAHPPTFNATLHHVRQLYAAEPFSAPLGWYRMTDGRPDCVVVRLLNDTYHILITGMSRGGKDNLALNFLFSLVLRYTPQHIQVCIIDGKGLDFTGWQQKAHTWRLATDPKQIGPAMEALSAERERRRSILERAGVSKWENYRGGDLPLLAVYVSELSLLEDAVGKAELTAWLNSELAAGAAFGIRYLIATQTASNFGTRWRSQISLYLAGFQPSQSQDQPNTGLMTAEIKSAGGVPPSELLPPPRGAGVFTCIQGREAITVRASLLTDEQRKGLLARLPDTPERIPTVPAVSVLVGTPVNAVLAHSDALIGCSQHVVVNTPEAAELPHSATVQTSLVNNEQEQPTVVEVPEDERIQILALAKSGLSRRKIALQVYGGMGKYERIKTVLGDQEHESKIAPTISAA